MSPIERLIELGKRRVGILIRTAFSLLIILLCYFASFSNILSAVLLAISVMVSGYDVLFSALDDVEQGKYFTQPVIVVTAAVLSFVIGFRWDSVFLLILYHLLTIALELVNAYVTRRMDESLRGLDPDKISEVVNIADASENTSSHYRSISAAASRVLLYSLVFAALYAIIVPIISNITVRDAIHRALCIVCLSQTVSITLSFPFAFRSAVYHCASKGIRVLNPDAFERLTETEVAIVDQQGIFSDGVPKITSIVPNVIPLETFQLFVAHACYYSNQKFAAAIKNGFEGDYRLELISDFHESDNRGVSVKIGGVAVFFGSPLYLKSEGYEVPPDDSQNKDIRVALIVAGKYVGSVFLQESVPDEARDFPILLKNSIAEKCILISSEESEDLAFEIGFDTYLAYASDEERFARVEEISASNTGTVFIYGDSIHGHSKAGLDIRFGTGSKYADISIEQKYPDTFGQLAEVSDRLVSITSQNALFALIVKAVLLFLSMIGLAHLWLVILVDSAAGIGTLLNLSRLQK